MCAQVCVLHKEQNRFWKQSSTSVVTLHEPFILLTSSLTGTQASLARLLVSDSKGSFWLSFPNSECHHTQLWVQGIKFAPSWLLSKHLATSSLSWYFKDYSIFIGLVKKNEVYHILSQVLFINKEWLCWKSMELYHWLYIWGMHVHICVCMRTHMPSTSATVLAIWWFYTVSRTTAANILTSG